MVQGKGHQYSQNAAMSSFPVQFPRVKQTPLARAVVSTRSSRSEFPGLGQRYVGDLACVPDPRESKIRIRMVKFTRRIVDCVLSF